MRRKPFTYVLHIKLTRSWTLPAKYRLILTSVIVGFFINTAIGVPSENVDGHVLKYEGELLQEKQLAHASSYQDSIASEEDNSRSEKKVAEEAEDKEYKENKRALTTEEHVRDYFSDVPAMVDVARCESHFRHFDKDGSVLKGTMNGSDVGVMQINKEYHGQKATELGLDIYSVEGNLEYARYLYEEQGLAPWMASEHCWNSNQEVVQK
ncbi:MAG: hypothetical protein ACLFNR_00650 [Candidatus Paceibacterota bacterium]